MRLAVSFKSIAIRAKLSRGLTKLIRWDVLDILYFGGYALWNYLSFPFLLTQRGVQVRALDRNKALPGYLIVCASFPEGLATHSREQRFHIDHDRLLLRRHDYVANVIGRWASAANFCLAFEDVAGLRLYAKRRVGIEFADLKVEMA